MTATPQNDKTLPEQTAKEKLNRIYANFTGIGKDTFEQTEQDFSDIREALTHTIPSNLKFPKRAIEHFKEMPSDGYGDKTICEGAIGEVIRYLEALNTPAEPIAVDAREIERMDKDELDELREAIEMPYCEAAQYYENHQGTELYIKARNAFQIIWKAAESYAALQPAKPAETGE